MAATIALSVNVTTKFGVTAEYHEISSLVLCPLTLTGVVVIDQYRTQATFAANNSPLATVTEPIAPASWGTYFDEAAVSAFGVSYMECAYDYVIATVSGYAAATKVT